MAVTLNDTHGSAGYGGQAAGPVFAAVGTEVMRVLDVPKDDISDEVTIIETAAHAADDTSDLAVVEGDDEQPNILEESDDDQPQTQPTNFVGPRLPASQPAGPVVPNFRGKTMRDVLAEAAVKGLNITPEGSGVARVQHPPAGSVLRAGEHIRVQFAR
jgi:hypothetical protein